MEFFKKNVRKRKYNMKHLITIITVLINTTLLSQSYAEVKQYIYDSTNLQHKEIVLRQSILETGWFKSYNCRVRHNLFGFWNSSKQEYFKFDRWQESVNYYVRWQKRKYKNGDYYTFLTNIGYATDPEYIKKLKSISIR
jgi:flagellum-specific peptidoglycan hydrolase FlgJ